MANKRLCHIDEVNNLEFIPSTHDHFDTVSSHLHCIVIAYSFVTPKTKTSNDVDQDTQVSTIDAALDIVRAGAKLTLTIGDCKVELASTPCTDDRNEYATWLDP